MDTFQQSLGVQIHHGKSAWKSWLTRWFWGGWPSKCLVQVTEQDLRSNSVPRTSKKVSTVSRGEFRCFTSRFTVSPWMHESHGWNRGVWAYRRQQWLCLLMEKLRVPFPLLLPKPVFIIIDQFEELLKKPGQHFGWAWKIVEADVSGTDGKGLGLMENHHSTNIRSSGVVGTWATRHVFFSVSKSPLWVLYASVFLLARQKRDCVY